MWMGSKYISKIHPSLMPLLDTQWCSCCRVRYYLCSQSTVDTGSITQWPCHLNQYLFQIWQLLDVHSFHNNVSANTLIHVFVTLEVDYSGRFLISAPKKMTNKLQQVRAQCCGTSSLQHLKTCIIEKQVSTSIVSPNGWMSTIGWRSVSRCSHHCTTWCPLPVVYINLPTTCV